ncbi:YchF/TatD family DNA exonuclease [bacterium]|nr:YchF/TatD family DNA exonuclease [bacterium]
MNSFIDTHTHLFAEEFNADLPEVVRRATEAGVQLMLLPNIDVASIEALYRTQESFPEVFRSMMGLHPCSVKENFKEDLNRIEKELNSGKDFVAVGEIGLDYYWDSSFAAAQQEAFNTQLSWARELDLPVAIHTRNSFDDSIKCVEKMQDGRLRGVFHCFGGTVDEGKRIMDAGFFLGIGGVATFKKSNSAEVLPQLGLERILLETDSPYLAPVPYRGKRNESSYVPLVAQKLASIYEMPLDHIASVTSQNAVSLFRL